MKISFLVTYYRQKRYVRESMDSILALEKPADWEILIGDDGSDDGTVAEAQRYVAQDPAHIHLFVMPRDPEKQYNPVERASLNRLNLIRHAAGDCCCLMDGDDFYSETDFIPQAVQLLETHPEVRVIAFDTWMYPDSGPRRAPAKGNARPVPVPRRRYLRWQYTHAGACVIRNDYPPETLSKLEALGSFDDNDIVLSALARGEMIQVRRPVYAYRQAQGSVYTAMNPAEQAALNIAGLGAALRIMGPAWRDDVLARYATAVWMGWFLRKKLPDALESAKLERYLTLCRRADFPEGGQLLQYPALSSTQRKALWKWVRRAGLKSPPRVVYAWLQTHRQGGKHE